MMKAALNPPTALKLALLASVFSLALALVAQYGFGLAPCHLCIAQRVPYGVVIWLALIGLAVAKRRPQLLALIAVTFLVGGGIAVYHAAVEKQLIAGPSGCTAQAGPSGESLDDFMKRINSAPVVACDQPQWEWHSVTMAGLNAVWSLGLAAFTFAAMQQSRRGTSHA